MYPFLELKLALVAVWPARLVRSRRPSMVDYQRMTTLYGRARGAPETPKRD